MTKLASRGSRTIISGSIVAAKSQQSKNGSHQIVLSIENGDTPAAVFLTDYAPGKGLASRIDKIAESRAIVGDNMIFDVTATDKPNVYLANGFIYRGMLTLKDDNGEEYVLVGYPSNPRDWGENNKNYSVRVPVEEWDPETKSRVTKWYEVSFFEKFAEAARKLTKEKGLVAIHATGMRRTEKDGRVYLSVVGDEVTRL